LSLGGEPARWARRGLGRLPPVSLTAQRRPTAGPGGVDQVELPEPLSYRLKKKLLGPPLVTERLAEERLGKPTALGVLSPDCISSTAYGSEEMLTILVPAAGVLAFSLLMPITFAVIGVLFFVTLSYREVVTVYTRAGGAYVVARENFGPRFAQVGAVALIIDYIVTVAVQTSAGTDAVTSAFPVLKQGRLPLLITCAVVVILCYGNLRGIREAGRTFAIPTYLFICATGLVIVVGIVRSALGQIHHHAIDLPGALRETGSIAHPSGLLLGVSLFVVLRAFANGGSSLTGLEAISNGVANFKPPEGRNARRVLVLMSTILGALVLGVSFLAWKTHAVPFTGGSPTVLSQEARYVFGGGPIGKVGFYAVQFSTMLILWTGANTSFNGFPNLASFVANDAFLPPALLRRGHRLVFSNGILLLAAVSLILLVVTDASVDALVAVYAIGVFTGFTLAGAGMVRYHLREREKGWARRLVINGFAAVLSLIVVVIFAVTKFTQGAWVVVVVGPILVVVLIRLHRLYTFEQAELERNAQRAAEAPVLRRHVVFVLVERLDLAAARALQYARSVSPQLRAVHFVLDTAAAHELQARWTRLGLSQVTLELVECPDRRLGRATLELVADAASDGETEVSVFLPRAVVQGPFRRYLHGRTSERVAALIGQVPNATATIVPFVIARGRNRTRPRWHDAAERAQLGMVAPADGAERAGAASSGAAPAARRAGAEQGRGPALGNAGDVFGTLTPPPGTAPIATLRARQRARVAGRVRSVRVQPRAGISSLECTLVDDTGQMLLIFQGRRLVPGIEPGARLLAEGMVGERGRRLAMINPSYTILASPEPGAQPG
jgi:amino acid transporter